LNIHGIKTKGPTVLHLIANFILNYTLIKLEISFKANEKNEDG
jgi:hypothetical protein